MNKEKVSLSPLDSLDKTGVKWERNRLKDDGRIWVVLLLMIFGIGIFLRVWTVGYKAPWYDEVHSIWYAQMSVQHLIDFGRTTDIHPPVYFLSLKGWSALFGDSREAARLFSSTLGVACIGLLFAIVHRLFGMPAALIAAGFFATFPTAVHYAREIRMYPLLTFLFLLSFLSFLGFYQQLTDGRGAGPAPTPLLPMAGFSLSLTIAFYTHYTAAIFFMLYTLFGFFCLIRGDRRTLIYSFLGLFVATMMVLPQIIHLFSNSMSHPAKAWMQATTWSLFFDTTIGIFPYHNKFLKLLFFVVFFFGFLILWRQDRALATLFFLFTAGGMLLAALIGIFEPMYLDRTIQVYTVFISIFVAVLLVNLPRLIAGGLGAVLIGTNMYMAVQNNFIGERMPILAEQSVAIVSLLDPERDQVFVKDYTQLKRQMAFMQVPLYEIAQTISHKEQDAGITLITEEAARCFKPTGEGACRSVVLIIEKESRVNVEAIAAWNRFTDELKAAYPFHVEQLVAGYRMVIFSRDVGFLQTVEAAWLGRDR